MNYDHSIERCPKCGGETHQDSVDVGVGMIFGPRGCTECGWSEDEEYNMTNPENRKPTEHGGYKDQFGGYHPPGSSMALAHKLAEREELCEDEGCPHAGTPHVCVSRVK